MRYRMQSLIVSILFLSVSSICVAQEKAVDTEESRWGIAEILDEANYPLEDEGLDFKTRVAEHYHQLRMKQEDVELYECVLLSALALISLLIVLRYMKNETRFTASHVVNAAGLIFIIFGTILLVIMAATEQQLTAAMGILGGVAGYLFGTLRKDEGGERPADGV